MPKNNETTTKFKVDISELKKSMQEARKQVAYANSEFKEASSSMDDWSKSSDGISAKLKQLNSNLKAQETVLSEYEKTLEEVKKEYGENSAEALEYATKLNNQKAAVNKLKKEIAGYEDSLKEVSEAEKIASKTGKDVADVLDDMGDKSEDVREGFTVLKGAVAEFVGNALTQLVGVLKDSITSLVTFGDEADKALNSFQASTGASTEEIAEFDDVMKNIYKANYGESFEDIAGAMGEVKKIAGDIGADELEKMTTKALILRDTFDFEVPESMRASNSLMDQFGITADEAFNLMAQGAQSGLNQNGDLLDVINEYSVHFQRAGYSADDMFNMLSNGVEAGTWSVDKLGDAVKEFNIRMSDGSAKDAVEALGFEWESVSEAWSAGGDEAKEMFDMMMYELEGLEDTTDGYNIGVGLLGTMFEDLGYNAVLALSQTEGEINKTKDSMEEINAIKYNTVGEALSGIGRRVQTDLVLPISEKLLPIISDLAVKFSEWLNDPATQEGIQAFTDSVAEFVDNGLVAVKDFIAWFLENKDAIIAGLAGIATGFVAFKVAGLISSAVTAFSTLFTTIKTGKTVMDALNLAFGLSPIGLITTAIGLLVAGFIYLWNTCEPFKQFWIDLWEGIKNGVSTAVEEIGKFFTETIPNFFSGLIDWIKENWQSILLFLINPFAGLFKYFYDNNGKFKEFVDNAIKFIKQLPAKAWTWLQNTINKITQWRTDMINKARETASSFINKVIEFIQQLPSKVWSWLNNVISRVITFGSNLAAKGKEAGQKLFNGIVDTVKGLPDKFISIGGDVISGLWNGISGAIGGLYDNIKNSLSGLVDKAKDALGINSPSKVFADEVGKWIPEGIAVGITKNAKSTLNAMKELTADSLGSARAGLSITGSSTGGVGAVKSGGVVNNFTQVINSPKQLSRLEIYRQSKNLLGYAGGGF